MDNDKITQVTRKGSLDGGNEADLELLVAVWCACLGLVVVLLLIGVK